MYLTKDQFSYYKTRCIEMMSSYEEKANHLMSDVIETSILEKVIWESIDKKDSARLKYCYNKLCKLVDGVS